MSSQPIQSSLIAKLTAQFAPSVLQIENESHKHRAERGAESHFKVVIVSEQFAQQRSVARHRAVYACLADELANGVHALALHTYTAAEWQAAGENAPRSPHCVGAGH